VDVIYGLIPMMLIFGFLVVVVFIWMAKSGHFDDMDGQANRIFMDDEYPEEVAGNNQEKKTDGDSQESLNEEQKADK